MPTSNIKPWPIQQRIKVDLGCAACGQHWSEWVNPTTFSGEQPPWLPEGWGWIDVVDANGQAGHVAKHIACPMTN